MFKDLILAGILCGGFYALSEYVKNLCRNYQVNRQR